MDLKKERQNLISVPSFRLLLEIVVNQGLTVLPILIRTLHVGLRSALWILIPSWTKMGSHASTVHDQDTYIGIETSFTQS